MTFDALRTMRWIGALALGWTLQSMPAAAQAGPALVPGKSAPVQERSILLPAGGSIEVAFSPSEGSEALIVKVVDSAASELRILAYSFTSASMVRALLRAKKRGVDVRLVVDHDSNVRDDRTGRARAALSSLVTAGISVRTIDAYAIHHDKVIVADRQTVELGSYNYSESAARRNSENVFVNWRNPHLAQAYLLHFERNYRLASDYQIQY